MARMTRAELFERRRAEGKVPAGAAWPPRAAPTTSAGGMRPLEGEPKRPAEDQSRIDAAEAAVGAALSRLDSLAAEVRALQSGLTALESAVAVARARMDAANAAVISLDSPTQGTLNLE